MTRRAEQRRRHQPRPAARGTYQYDLDRGVVQKSLGSGVDLWWEQVNGVQRYLVFRKRRLVHNRELQARGRRQPSVHQVKTPDPTAARAAHACESAARAPVRPDEAKSVGALVRDRPAHQLGTVPCARG